MGQAVRGSPGDGGEGGRTVASKRRVTGGGLSVKGRGPWGAARSRRAIRRPFAFLLRLTLLVTLFTLCRAPSSLHAQSDAPLRLDRGRFTVVCYPSEQRLAGALVDRALVTDTFPGLPRPNHHVLIAIAPDQRRFRAWAGPNAPEWGAALAFPDSRRIVMQGRSAGSDAGDPFEVLRHELAHLALHEYLGDLAPRWFDEGYASFAARELMRNDMLAANFALAIRGMPTLDELDDQFTQGATSAQAAYALAYRAVDDMASMDPRHGLALLLHDWKQTGSLDRAMREAFGTTLAAFERDWQKRTRQRYGGLALFSDLTLATLVVLLVVTPLYLARRRRDRERMAALLAADAESAQNDDALLDAFIESTRPEEGLPGPGPHDGDGPVGGQIPP
jgi:peptidase MA superfamily protein